MYENCQVSARKNSKNIRERILEELLKKNLKELQQRIKKKSGGIVRRNVVRIFGRNPEGSIRRRS